MLLCLKSSNLNTNNQWKLDKPITGLYKLVAFVSTNNMYNVNDTNNKIYLNESGNDLTAILTNGYYDAIDLRSEISSKLNSVCGGTVTVTFNSNVRKYTITNTNNFYFKFGSNTSNSARKLVGFNASDGSNNTTHTSDNCIDLNTYKNVYINIKESDDRNIYGMNYFSTSLVVCGDGNFGELMRYKPNEHFDQYIKFSKSVKILKIRMHDADNNDINLNSEYSIILQKINK